MDTAIRYANISSSGEKKENTEFGVMIGLSTDALEHLRTCTILSDTPEIGIKDHIPLEYIKMLAVPSNKVEFVKKLIGDTPIEVMPMNIEDPFYGMTRYDMKKALEITDEKQVTNEFKIQSEYKQDDVRKLAKGRKLSKLLGWLTKSKEKTTNRGEEDESVYR